MQQFFVYILRCNDGSYYTGVTNDLEHRLSLHQMGADPFSYTYQRRPVRLVFSETFDSINTAIEREKQIQRWSRKKKEALIAGDWDRLCFLAKSKKKSTPN